MIVGSWKNTNPVCANHIEFKMQLIEKKSTFYYQCPICNNLISTNDFEKILNKLSDFEDEQFINKEIGSLAGKSFTVGKGIKCEIIKDDEESGKRTVSIKNPKEI